MLRMKVRALLSRCDISVPFKFGELQGGHCSFQSFAVSSRGWRSAFEPR